jgi:hypothetical protein
MNRGLSRDERELGVDQAADRLSYLVLAFGLLIAVAYRGFANDESAWDLLGLVVLSGLVGVAYRARERVVSRRWMAAMIVTGAIALAVAAIVVVVTRS